MSILTAPQLRGDAPYQPTERIGAGAMGDVWLARDRRDGSWVVVKVMHGHLPEALIDRLRLEAQALKKIVHPNIVRMLDWGSTTDHRPFIVLEHLTGTPLDVLMKQRQVALADAVQLVIELLGALTAVHEAGMVHRDVKPSNCFVCQPGGNFTGNLGTLKLLDFGIVKLVETVTGIAPLQAQTKAGSAIGTPRFMSPEQCRGKKVDGRSDLYSVGCILYELVAGRHPFADATKLEQMMIAHATRIPSAPSSVALQPIPPRLDGIILTALEKDPEKRHPNAAEFSRALRFFAMDFLGADGSVKQTTSDDGTIVPIGETAALADPPATPETLAFRAVAPPRAEELPSAPVVPRVQPGSRSAAVAQPQAAAPAAPRESREPLPRPAVPAEMLEPGAPIGRFLLTFVIVVAIAVGLYLALGTR